MDNNIKDDFFSLAEAEVGRLRAIHRFSSADNLRMAIRHLRVFCGARRLAFARVTPLLMADFQDHLRSLGLKAGYVSLIMRSLRKIYRRAVKMGLVADASPFADVSTANARCKRHVLPEEGVARLLAARVKPGGWMERAHDVACLSYYLCGMPPVDIIHLRWADINPVGRTLSYSRRKTGVSVSLRIQPEAWRIIRKYRGKGRLGYVFPFVTTTDPQLAHRQYTSAVRQMNRCLNKLGSECGLGVSLSLYAMRRAWASVAFNDYNAHIGTISSALCHTSVRTTELYIGGMSSGVLLRLQNEVYKGVRRKVARILSRCPPIYDRGTLQPCMMAKK